MKCLSLLLTQIFIFTSFYLPSAYSLAPSSKVKKDSKAVAAVYDTLSGAPMAGDEKVVPDSAGLRDLLDWQKREVDILSAFLEKEQKAFWEIFKPQFDAFYQESALAIKEQDSKKYDKKERLIALANNARSGLEDYRQKEVSKRRIIFGALAGVFLIGVILIAIFVNWILAISMLVIFEAEIGFAYYYVSKHLKKTAFESIDEKIRNWKLGIEKSVREKTSEHERAVTAIPEAVVRKGALSDEARHSAVGNLSDDISRDIMWEIIKMHNGNDMLECGFDVFSAVLFLRGIKRSDGSPYSIGEIRKYMEKHWGSSKTHSDNLLLDTMDLVALARMLRGKVDVVAEIDKNEIKGIDSGQEIPDQDFDAYWRKFTTDLERYFKQERGPIVFAPAAYGCLIYGIEKQADGEYVIKIMDPHADYKGMDSKSAVTRWKKEDVKKQVEKGSSVNREMAFQWLAMPPAENAHWEQLAKEFRDIEGQAIDPKKDLDWKELYNYFIKLMAKHGANKELIYQHVEAEMAKGIDVEWKKQLKVFKDKFVKGNNMAVRVIDKKGLDGFDLKKLFRAKLTNSPRVAEFRWENINWEENEFKAICQKNKIKNADRLWEIYKQGRDSWENITREMIEKKIPRIKGVFGKAPGHKDPKQRIPVNIGLWKNISERLSAEAMRPSARYFPTGELVPLKLDVAAGMQDMVELNMRLPQRIMELCKAVGFDFKKIVVSDNPNGYSQRMINLNKALFDALRDYKGVSEIENGFAAQLADEIVYHELVHYAISSGNRESLRKIMNISGNHDDKWPQVERALDMMSQMPESARGMIDEAIVLFITHNHYWDLDEKTRKNMDKYKKIAGDAMGRKAPGTNRTLLGNLREVKGAKDLPLDAFLYIAVGGMDGKVILRLRGLAQAQVTDAYDYILKQAEVRSLIYGSLIENGILKPDVMQGVGVNLRSMLGADDKSFHRDYLIESLAWAMLKQKRADVFVPKISIDIERYREFLSGKLGERAFLLKEIFTDDIFDTQDMGQVISDIRERYSLFKGNSGEFMANINYGLLLVDEEEIAKINKDDFQSIQSLEWAA